MSVEACGVAERPERCERCRYAGAIAGQGVMTCRRYPPAGAGGWPHVGAVDWCGEWASLPVSERLRRVAVASAPGERTCGNCGALEPGKEEGTWHCYPAGCIVRPATAPGCQGWRPRESGGVDVKPTADAAGVGTGMKLYAWRPDGHGQLSFFVMAESEQAARAAVEAAVERIRGDGRRYDVDGWGTDYYELSVYAAGEVAEHYIE